MGEFVDERRYAWRMLRAARAVQSAGIPIDGAATCRAEIIALVDEALDEGLDRAELIIELANLGARFLALCDDEGAAAYDFAAEDVEICLN